MLVSSFNLSQSFNYTPYLFYKKEIRRLSLNIILILIIRRLSLNIILKPYHGDREKARVIITCFKQRNNWAEDQLNLSSSTSFCL
jgi:hypothetical protein